MSDKAKSVVNRPDVRRMKIRLQGDSPLLSDKFNPFDHPHPVHGPGPKARNGVWCGTMHPTVQAVRRLHQRK